MQKWEGDETDTADRGMSKFTSRQHIQSAIDELKNSISTKRAERLGSCRVVGQLANNAERALIVFGALGATSVATGFEVMRGSKFSIVLLDESSQMIEPQRYRALTVLMRAQLWNRSLLPIVRFGCERLLAVGDPKQLPPTLEGSAPPPPNPNGVR